MPANKSVEELQKELERLRKLVADENDENQNKEDDQEEETDEEDTSKDDEQDNDDNENASDENQEDENDDDDKTNDTVAALKNSLNALDKKYKEALKEKKAIEKAQRDSEIAALKKEGKELEAIQKERDDMEAELAVLREENISMKRDNVLDSALSGMEFKSKRSRDMARRDIVDNLVKNDDGSWSAKDGKSIDDYTASYFEDEDNRSLFLKAKTNSGTGVDTKDANKNITKETPKSVFDIPQSKFMQDVRRKLGQ